MQAEVTNDVTAAEQSSVVRTRAGDGSRGDRTALGASNGKKVGAPRVSRPRWHS